MRISYTEERMRRVTVELIVGDKWECIKCDYGAGRTVEFGTDNVTESRSFTWRRDGSGRVGKCSKVGIDRGAWA